MTFDRRTFIAASAATAAAPLLPACASPGTSNAAATDAAPYPAFIGKSTQTLLPRGKAPRIVICGGGWGGPPGQAGAAG